MSKECKDIRFKKELNYSINTLGIIKQYFPDGSLSPIKTVIKKDGEGENVYVLLYDTNESKHEIRLMDLMMNIYCGPIDNPEIWFKDGDRTNCSTKNIDYTNYELVYNDDKTILTINNEEFKQIPGFKTYYISKRGTIYGAYYKKFIKRMITDNGFYAAALSDEKGKRQPYRVHRLVWLTWVGEIPEGMIVDQKDNDKLNPSLENLQLSSNKINSSNSPLFKKDELTLDEVYQIRINHKRGESINALKNKFNVPNSTICDIINYKTYKYLICKPDTYQFNREDINDINYKYHFMNLLSKEIALFYMCDQTDIESVLNPNFKDIYKE